MAEQKEIPGELTQEQLDRRDEYIQKWREIGLDCGECDFAVVKDAIKRTYEVVGVEPPKHFIGPYDSPYVGALAAHAVVRIAEEQIDYGETTEDLEKLVNDEVQAVIASGEKPSEPFMSGYVYGHMEYWLAFYDYIQEVVGIELKDIEPMITAAQNCGWWIPFEEVVILQHRPLEIHLDEEDRLHNTEGPAIKYRGDCEFSHVYVVHGVRVPKSLIDRNYTAEDVDNETNQEIKRIMIELFRNPETGEEGQHEYIKAANAEKISTDDFGTLWRKEIKDDEDIMMVEVLNSTAEPDGTYKTYFLRVDPNAYGGLENLPPRAAIASTFREPDDQTQMLFKNWTDYTFIQES